MEEPTLWDDPEKASGIVKELGGLKAVRDSFNKLQSDYDDIAVLIEMADEENDASLVPEIGEAIKNLEEELDRIRIQTLLSDEYDKNNFSHPNTILSFKQCFKAFAPAVKAVSK